MLIKCACGCGEELEKYDSRRRERKFIRGHAARVLPSIKKSFFKKGHKIHLGKKHSKETLQKMSDSHKGLVSGMKGKTHSIDSIKMMSSAKQGCIPWNKNKKLNPLSKNHKKKISKSWNNLSIIDKEVRKEKLRKTRFAYLKEIGKINGPNIGRYEKSILDALEKCFGYEIKRQKYVNGYFIDGYCSMLNLAIEIDEKQHRGIEQMKKDNYRENIIKNELQCNFVRIDIGDIQ